MDECSEAVCARADVVAAVAKLWRDPDHPARQEVVERALASDRRFTEPALAFAINERVSKLTSGALCRWIDGLEVDEPISVGVLTEPSVPLAGLRDLLAVVLVGHRYVGGADDGQRPVLTAFGQHLAEHGLEHAIRFEPVERVFEEVKAVVANGDDEQCEWVVAQCDAHQIPPGNRFLRRRRYGVAVLDGDESADEREGLAEDCLLYEGMGDRSTRLVWAPSNLEPDPYLEAMAQFRSVFPTHERTPGQLKMQQAFLDATGASHAYGEGLEFLVSRGEPAVQQEGHVRWSEYDALDDVRVWLEAHHDDVELVVARPSLMPKLDLALPTAPIGDAHRLPVGWERDDHELLPFLAVLG